LTTMPCDTRPTRDTKLCYVLLCLCIMWHHVLCDTVFVYIQYVLRV